MTRLSPNRRQFLAGVAAAGAVAATAMPARAKGTDVSALRTKSLDEVRIGLIGVGDRGYEHVRSLTMIDGVRIVAIADLYEDALEKSAAHVKAARGYRPVLITGSEEAYRDLLARDDIDAVVISTPWRWHVPMAVETMQSGKHAFVEVPAAQTVEGCWQLVETAEATGKHCMMLENCCYGRSELMVLNMVRQGLFGELTHGEGAYIHDLRWQMKDIERGTGSWRTPWHTTRDGNLYPTHGLGPIAQYMNINRGDRFDYLTSVSSPALGRAAYARAEFRPAHARNKAHYIAGDINTTLIKTVKGRSIMVQHDTTTARPYSRLNLIQGTAGVFAGFPDRIALDAFEREEGEHPEWQTDMAPWQARFDHPLWSATADLASEHGGHGGMDFVMMWRLIWCLRNGEPLDQSVYDAAAWSAIGPLSAASVAARSNSIDIPDFTRGGWQTAAPLGVAGV
ncbi:Gfo/Idh/MocA family protein [Pseudokordiimonas caeni]|uniref:Gfo/Idh/MocA family protein n=1 Tax=Pseudokordiimonas caeni TaxID=2997908 RepID=UPI002811194A|nr:Gfo/Idh/MocA family oxidoreductase [Pseudokordiimonas caeni]